MARPELTLANCFLAFSIHRNCHISCIGDSDCLLCVFVDTFVCVSALSTLVFGVCVCMCVRVCVWVQVAIGPPHLQIEYLCRLVACNDVTRRPVKSGPLRYCSMFLIFTCLGLITHYCTATTIHSYTHHHHIYIPPPHATTTTQCKLHECK